MSLLSEERRLLIVMDLREKGISSKAAHDFLDRVEEYSRYGQEHRAFPMKRNETRQIQAALKGLQKAVSKLQETGAIMALTDALPELEARFYERKTPDRDLLLCGGTEMLSALSDAAGIASENVSSPVSGVYLKHWVRALALCWKEATGETVTTYAKNPFYEAVEEIARAVVESHVKNDGGSDADVLGEWDRVGITPDPARTEPRFRNQVREIL